MKKHLPARIISTEQDISLLKKLSEKHVKAEISSDKYSRRIVRKPWGYEYLLYESGDTAAWVLYLNPGAQTSMHCHPDKKTSLLVLSGYVKCTTLQKEYYLEAADSLRLEKKVFHRTANISPDGVFLLEIESPVNKNNLVRAFDEYGRVFMGYEKADAHQINYNYLPFTGQKIYYNRKKVFGPSSIELLSAGELIRIIESGKTHGNNLISLLKGRMKSGARKFELAPADIVSLKQFERFIDMKTLKGQEFLLIRKAGIRTRLSDYLVAYLQERNIRHFFFVPETVNAHIVDAVLRNTNVKAYPLKTEAGAAMAAEALAKLTGEISVVIISSGASAVEAIKGLASAWIDSSPVLFIAAQSRQSYMNSRGTRKLRQLFNKEILTVPIAESICKCCVSLAKDDFLGNILDMMIEKAKEGRNGPCWLEIPLDLLGKEIKKKKTAGKEARKQVPSKHLPVNFKKIWELIENSKRPVILAGFGIRAAGAQENFLKLARQLSIPVLTSRRGVDIIAGNNPLYFGRPGSYGHRAANFIIQNSDLLISIGSRLSLPLIGKNFHSFAPKAKKIIVDIDENELHKETVSGTMGINCDAGDFIKGMLDLGNISRGKFSDWICRCKQWNRDFPPNEESRNYNGKANNPYSTVEVLSEILVENDIIVCDGGTCLDYLMQGFKVKTGQRIISPPGLEQNGFSIPGAIGISLSNSRLPVVCLCDKAGLQRSISELQIITEHRLPVKIFVLNTKLNDRIHQTQAEYFGDRHTDTSDNFLLVGNIAQMYDIKSCKLQNSGSAEKIIRRVISSPEPFICDVRIPGNQEVIPRLTYKVEENGEWVASPLHDMYPFLPPETIENNMIK